MTAPDIVTILGNISQSLYPVQHLITGIAYLLGILFFVGALEKLKNRAGQGSHGSSQESIYSPLLYIVAGSALIYLPSTLDLMANTAFGTGNILTYPTIERSNVYSTVGAFVRTAGIIWFIRGTVLISHASQPGNDDNLGMKGLLFILAGIMAMNFDNTVAFLNSSMSYIINLTLSFKASQGY